MLKYIASLVFNFDKMKCYSVLFVLLLATLVDSKWHRRSMKKQNTPPHCTQVTKDTDYESRFKYDYPIVYIPPGQHEAYQQLFCVNPPTVNKAVTVVCDWAAPPMVQFTLGDDYMHVQRQDPTGRFLGNAVITTYQYCNHNLHSAHVEGEKMSYQYNSFIPAFTPVYSLNVTPDRPDYEKRFTYLRAEYMSPMTSVDVIFNAETLGLTFYVRFPFFNIPFGVVGYSVKEIHTRVWTSWRKLNRNLERSFGNYLPNYVLQLL